MRSLMGLVIAGGLVLGMAGDSKAQVGITIGTPPGFSYGFPNYSSYGYSGIGGLGYGGLGNSGLGYGGLGYGGYGNNNYYSSGILAGPGGFSYSSGYRGLTTPVAPLAGYGYGYAARPYYGGVGYGVRPYYGGYGYGYRGGFRPFGMFGRRYR